MSTLTPTRHSITAIMALGLDFQESLAQDELEPIVYLLDQAGGRFGYRYEWEELGPFSAELVRDLTHLSDRDIDEASQLSEADLDDDLQTAVERVKPLIEPPGSKLTRAGWLRLLAAVHFLESRTKLEVGNGRRVPFVDSHFDDEAIRAAKERLVGFG